MAKMISIKERLPDVGVWVIVWNTIMGWDIDKLNEDGQWALTNDPITHWMPLPEPPKKEG